MQQTILIAAEQGGVFEIVALIVVLVISLAVSVAITSAAAGSEGVAWGWALLGPMGWLIAALRGIQERMDEQAPPGLSTAPPSLGPLDVRFVCPSCDELKTVLRRLVGRPYTCGSCGAEFVVPGGDDGPD